MTKRPEYASPSNDSPTGPEQRRRPLRPGDNLEEGRFLLEQPLRRGAIATIWQALDRRGEARVAIKVLHAELAEDPERREHFFRSARQMAELEHAAVVRVLEPRGEQDEHRYVVMEWLGGVDFETATLRRQLEEDDVIRITLQIGAALADAHQRGYLHGAVRPGHILLDERGNARLTDFDPVPAAAGAAETTHTGALGAGAYLAPELAEERAAASASTDTYGLAMTALFGLRGQLSLRDLYQRAPLIEGLRCSPQTKAVLARAIAPESEQRQRSVNEFCRELEHAWFHDRRGRDFSGQVLRAGRFDDVDFTLSNLSGADLGGASLRGATLVRTSLRSARLQAADLTRADLTQADLMGADLRGAQLEGATFRGANLIGARFDEGALPADPRELERLDLALHAQRDGFGVPGCTTVAFSPDESLLASGHMEGSIQLWDAQRSVLRRTLRASAHAVWQVAFSPTGQLLAAVSWDDTVRLWSLRDGNARVVGRGSWTVAFDARGARLASGSNDGAVRLWDTASGAALGQLEGHGGSVRCIAFAPTGPLIATGSDDDTLRLWHADTRRPLHVLRPARARAAAPRAREARLEDESGPVSMRSVCLASEGDRLGTLVRVRYPVRSLAFSPDSRRVAAGWDDGVIRVFDTSTGAELGTLQGHADWVRSVSFSPSGEHLASAADDHTLRLWNTRTFDAEHTQSSRAFSVAFSPSGAALACAQRDGAVEVLDATSCARLATLVSADGDWAAFTPDGRYKLPAGEREAPSFSVGRWRIQAAELSAHLPGLIRVADDEPLTASKASPP